MPPPVQVLHVPYTYFPDAAGGTEVYVRALAARLGERGYASAIAAPGTSTERYICDGMMVYRFETDRRPRLELAYGAPDDLAAAGFRAILQQAAPQIVHLHARTAAVSEALVDAARGCGARVVFTYHTPTVSCARGAMMLFGKTPCDGRIQPGRCVACTLQGLGVPEPAARLAGAATATLGPRLAARAARLPLPNAARIPLLVAAGGGGFASFMHKIDRVVAVCDWVRDVLIRNGVPAASITVSRQGVPRGRASAQPCGQSRDGGPLRIAYLGRIDPAKGLDLLVRALALIPEARVRVDLYAVRQGESAYADRLTEQVRADDRLRLQAPVPPDTVVQVMARYDLIAVPSRWLETGPLVVHEAFAAGVPVLGARLGGIAELVRDGVDGMLVAPDDPAAWAGAIERLAGEPALLAAMRANSPVPRTMDDAADDMAGLYAELLA